MNAERRNPWKSRLSLLAFFILGSSLVSCGGNGGAGQSEPAANSPAASVGDEAERYREKVKKQVSGSVIRSFSREWNVPESKIECLLADLEVMQLEDAGSDADVAAVFEQCDVDPAVAE
jgi:hypothetical protein